MENILRQRNEALSKVQCLEIEVALLQEALETAIDCHNEDEPGCGCWIPMARATSIKT
ncbi:hypothetical protein LCGC14_1907420 [marine sediment metagenome]|uniref:Uncharacterized protein n=1 Tax=marine sediment metagenome TaxID=412755 RepID=A0A0F9ISS5_9ZZZZ